MPNPVLNERTISKARNTWPPPEPPTYYPPVTDGPVSAWRPKVMTVNGTITATATLFALLLASAAVGWISTGAPERIGETNEYRYEFPALGLLGILVGFGIVIALMFKPHLARILAPIYAVAEGFALGAISRMYETYYDGIVVQAAGATVAVFAVMLVLYRTRIIKVTERFRTVVTTATLGVMLFYG